MSQHGQFKVGLDALAQSLSSSSTSKEATSSKLMQIETWDKTHFDHARRALEAANDLKTPVDAAWTSEKGRALGLLALVRDLRLPL